MELFGTAGIRGRVAERVTPELALAVARAAGAEARSTAGDPTFVVGRDGRTTGPSLVAAVAAGLTSAGVDVVRVGQVPTPALAFASRDRRGLMVTASHNPPTDNGLKLFVDGVEYDRERERAVERRVDDGVAPTSWDAFGTVRSDAPLPDYRRAVAAYARELGADLDGLGVVVDCGNGVGAPATPAVLDRLGGRVVTLNANVDGTFPGRASKPTAETLSDLRAFLADANADGGDGGAEVAASDVGDDAGDDADADDGDDGFAFGVGHDGDADRVAVVGPDGEMVHEDTVVAIVAERVVRAADVADPVVVTTPNASGRIDERVAAAGGRVERVRLGALHEGIATVRRDGGDVVYAAEPWKHVHPALGGWIDGVATVAVLARLVAGADGGLAALREPVTERPYRKGDVDCPDDAKAAAMDLVAERLPDAFPAADVDTEYGVRLSFPDASWLLVRPSGTEPYLRLYAEADDVASLLDDARSVAAAAVDDATG